MATKNVDTFPALKDAIINANGDDIYINSDMDASDYPITEPIKPADGNSYNVYGQGHTIYNITNVLTSETNCFVNKGAGSVCTWNDVNFNNIFITNRGRIITTVGNDSNYTTVTNCTFQGQWVALFGRGTYERCVVNGTGSLNLSITSGDQSSFVLNNSYVKLKNKRTDGYYAYYGTNLTNCYFTGSIDPTGMNTSQGIFTATRFTPSNCIFNIDISSDTAISYRWTSITTGSFGPQSEADVCLFNTDKLQNVTFSQTSQYLRGISDSDLKNASAVSAAGFPIIV